MLADMPDRALRDQTARLDLLEARLSAVDPRQALRRGYSITTTADGDLVRDLDQVTVGTELHTQLALGTVTSTVTSASPSSASGTP